MPFNWACSIRVDSQSFLKRSFNGGDGGERGGGLNIFLVQNSRV